MLVRFLRGETLAFSVVLFVTLKCNPLMGKFGFVCDNKVLDGSESQYSGMQIGTLQDEEDEGAASSSQEEPSEPFLQSALGMYLCAAVYTVDLYSPDKKCICVQP